MSRELWGTMGDHGEVLREVDRRSKGSTSWLYKAK